MLFLRSRRASTDHAAVYNSRAVCCDGFTGPVEDCRREFVYMQSQLALCYLMQNKNDYYLIWKLSIKICV